MKRVKVFFEGFKAFIQKGNIVDLAIAFILGISFKEIITSLVNDIIMPLFSSIAGESDFTNLIWVLNGAEIRYGAFIQTIINFLIIAFSIYVVVTLMIRRKQFEEKVKKEGQPEPPKEVVVPEDIKLLKEIRDELNKLNAKK